MGNKTTEPMPPSNQAAIASITVEAIGDHMTYGQKTAKEFAAQYSIEEMRKDARAMGDTKYLSVRQRMAIKVQSDMEAQRNAQNEHTID